MEDVVRAIIGGSDVAAASKGMKFGGDMAGWIREAQRSEGVRRSGVGLDGSGRGAGRHGRESYGGSNSARRAGATEQPVRGTRNGH